MSPRTARRRLVVAGLTAFVAVAAVVLFWFQPQKLLIDERVDDELPDARATADVDAAGEASAPEPPRDLARGDFVSLDHGTSGVGRIVDVDGRRIVRLESLRTDNGPDLFVYLSTNPVDGAEHAFDDDFVNLGRLRGNIGDQNYDLPDGVDLSRFRSIVIWCDRFNSAFGAAPIEV